MKALILAAGKGTRMLPLTESTPKPLLKVNDNPLLAHILESLPEEVSEIILVVGHMEDQIKDFFGTSYKARNITYITQSEAGGTWPACLLAKEFFLPDEKFLLTYADDIYDQKSIENCLKYDNATLVAKVEDPRRYGVVEVDQDGYIIDIEEKPQKPKTNIVAPGVYVLSSKIFEYQYPDNGKTEKYFTDVYAEYLKNEKVKAVPTKVWATIAFPEDLQKAEEVLFQAKSEIEEQCIQVDEQDNVIGTLLRSEFEGGKAIHRSAIGFVYKDDKILIAKRSASKKWYPNRWTYPVTGTVGTETVEECLIRETLEEIGVSEVRCDFKFKFLLLTDIDKAWHYFYIVDVGEQELVNKDGEVTDIQWIDIEKIKTQIIETPDNYTPHFVEGLRQYLKFLP